MGVFTVQGCNVLTHNERKRAWVLEDHNGEVVKRFNTKAAATGRHGLQNEMDPVFWTTG